MLSFIRHCCRSPLTVEQALSEDEEVEVLVDAHLLEDGQYRHRVDGHDQRREGQHLDETAGIQTERGFDVNSSGEVGSSLAALTTPDGLKNVAWF